MRVNTRRRHWFCLLTLSLGIATVPAPPAGAEVRIVVERPADGAVRLAAEELAAYLTRLYPEDQFVLAEEPDGKATTIYLGCGEAVQARLTAQQRTALQSAEAFRVTTVISAGRQEVVVAGADPQGVMYGVYGLLKELGCGFYCSFDALPEPKTGPFGVDEWDVADRPLVFDRIIFNWHNFLTSCSTWNLEHWQQWIARSQRAGYNAVMVHAYGNNPMAGFVFDGLQKPVGYLSSTRLGRDWATMHVNDVRRLFGGDVFESPVFGSSASVAGDDRRRTEAAQQLMSDVFRYAEGRGVKVFFALDVDTASANPQPLIESLPERARFAISTDGIQWQGEKTERTWLANPDTTEGYRYYKVQAEQLLRVYPGIDCLVIWFRRSNTPWIGMKLEELPEPWRRAYEEELRRTPVAKDYWHSHNLFAISRVVAAYRRALAELGREDVELAVGSWQYEFFPAADRFMPPMVRFLPLDETDLRGTPYLETPELRAQLAAAGVQRPVSVISWAHHDDGHYLGRPYLPTAGLASKLQDARSAGFGIIHWLTRPLDIYFDSMSRQTWHSTRDEPLEATCCDMAGRCFDQDNAEVLGRYLFRWLNEAPNFARETSPNFIDPRHDVADPAELEKKMYQRFALLDSIDRSKLTERQHEWLDYFKGLEHFILDAHRVETNYRRAKAALQEGRIDEARDAIAQADPAPVIERFARFSQLGGITRGEQGSVVSMNTRWLPHILRLRQQLGLEAVRYNFGATSHDPLAQSPGAYTFHFGPEHDIWQTLGEAETGATALALADDVKIELPDNAPPVWAEIVRSAVESSDAFSLTLQPILTPGRLPAGRYRLVLLMVEPTATGSGQRVFDIGIDAGSAFVRYRVAPVTARYLRLACHGSSANSWNSICEFRAGCLDRMTPVTASDAVKGYEPERAADGDPNTRWAANGPGNWLQFSLRPRVPLEAFDVNWYLGARRTYRFDVLVSDDGSRWRTLAVQETAAADEIVDRVDLFQRAGGNNRMVTVAYPVELHTPGVVKLTLHPVKGKPLVCAAVLMPVRMGHQTDS